MVGHYTLILLAVFQITAGFSMDSFFNKRYGSLGTDYNLAKGVPYLMCELERTKNGTAIYEECKEEGRSIDVKMGCKWVVKVKNMSIERDKNTILQPDEYNLMAGGCWHANTRLHSCVSKDECIPVFNENGYQNGVGFCCCSTHKCNSKVTVRFGNRTEPEILAVMHAWPLWICLGVALILAVLVVVLTCIAVRTKTGRRLLKKAADLHNPDAVPLVESGKRGVNLKERLTRAEVLAEGKMGIVYRAMYKDPETGRERPVVVKTVKEEKSFIVEERVYRLCSNEHPHVLHSLGTICDRENGIFEVVMEYQERGSLESYLQRATFTPLEALSFLCSFMDGLAFLHTTSTLSNEEIKKTIVHRDLKSRNVLVKADGTAAITDFGVAAVCDIKRLAGRQYQVGTHRYMSPELLVGQANLNVDGLKSADIYAASLIFWEVLNRTVIDENDEVQPAELPYSAEIDEIVVADKAAFALVNGPNVPYSTKPIQYYLKDIVHRDNKRPVLRKKLSEHEITYELVKTTIDLWNWEVEGRISAACAHSRLDLLQKEISDVVDDVVVVIDDTETDEIIPR